MGKVGLLVESWAKDDEQNGMMKKKPGKTDLCIDDSAIGNKNRNKQAVLLRYKRFTEKLNG